MSWASIAAGSKPPVSAAAVSAPAPAQSNTPEPASIPDSVQPESQQAVETTSIAVEPSAAASPSTGAWSKLPSTAAWGGARPSGVFGSNAPGSGSAESISASMGNVAISKPQVKQDLPSVACSTLCEALENLWELDDNRLIGGKDYMLDLQGYTRYHGTSDYAHNPLFKNFDEDTLKAKPTFATFLNLLDNYKREVGQLETESSDESAEIEQFLDAVMDTRVMKYCHKYLASKQCVSTSTSAFRSVLRFLWFQGYASQRGGPIDSSGFEHVFVGEEKGEVVTGMHNWIQLYREEQKEMLNYCGYISHSRSRPDAEGHILTLQFDWKDPEDGSVNRKPMSTSFIGVSPEFELALFTMAALAPSDSSVQTEGSKRVIQCQFEKLRVELNVVVWSRGSRKMLRTGYPEESR